MSTASDRSSARHGAGLPSVLRRILLGIVVIGLAALRGRRSRATPTECPPSQSEASQSGEKRARAGHVAEAAATPGRAAEPGRGREADKPTEIPARGWKDILWRTYEEINKDRIVAVAAGVTFYALLALFPAIAALVSIYGLFADAATIQDHLATIAVVLPGGALDMIGDQVQRIASKGSATLGFAFFSGLAISLWSANAGMKAMFDALNIVYGEDEKRGFIALNLRSLPSRSARIAVHPAGALGVVGDAGHPQLHRPGQARPSGSSRSRAGPSCWSSSSSGSRCSTATARAATRRSGAGSRRAACWPRWSGSRARCCFPGTSANFGNYNETYGSLGAAIGFMTWIWLSTTVVLIGAELNAEMEHQTARRLDRRTAKAARRARRRMADTVGEAKA